MSDLSKSRPKLATVCVAVAVVAVASAWPAAARSQATARQAGADTGPSTPIGSWAFRFDVGGAGGAVNEANVGTFDLLRQAPGAGTNCRIAVRSNFNGVPHDHVPPATSCTWSDSPSSPGLDGKITANGISDAGPVVISFVAAGGGQRLLLLLDAVPTAPGSPAASGVVGTGDAFRR